MRTSPPVLHAIPRRNEVIEVLPAPSGSIYALYLVEQGTGVSPISLRRVTHGGKGPMKYINTQHSTSGTSLFAARRANEMFGFVPGETPMWIASYQMVPVAETQPASRKPRR